MAALLPIRLVVCVDGTQYTPSAARNASASQTNIHRIYAGTKRGSCQCSYSVKTFNQIPIYVPGIGSADASLSTDRLQANIFGKGYLKQIQDVYESCSQLDGVDDEVWLFGFSRGGYVVRAVAGLLHTFGALASAGQPEYARDFKKILKEAERRQGHSSGLVLGPVSSMSSAGTRPGPKIRWVGVFDTVKAVGDDALFDVSLNPSIMHARQALALHEHRKDVTPEPIYPGDFYRTALQDSKRSFIQAWFTGNHADMGGAAKKAGLGLYPLQWMMLEAQAFGLVADSEGALSVVFPRLGQEEPYKWSCTPANGITVAMQDLRVVHHRPQSSDDYSVKLVTRHGSLLRKKPREPFSATGNLVGYCDWAPQGTIIHPSVYMMLDEHVNVALETKELEQHRHLENWRGRMLGSQNGVVNPGFWLDGDEEDDPDLGAIRVLVCGNTGVGKSTLINKTFGVDVTQSSNRLRGIHDVREEITFEGRPDLIVHDSGGFEAGADDEFQAVQEFLIAKSAAVDVKDQLHIIWFCIDVNSPRTLQTATEKLFQAVSQYARDVPIVVVATKKDDFLDLAFSAQRKALKKEGKRFDEEACEEYAEERLRERIEIIKAEMESVPGGRLDACVAVSQDDDESIADLSKTTSRCFDTDKVRLLYIRAQVTRIDLKVDMAVCEVMRRYRRLIRGATGSAFAPLGATINRKVSTVAVTKIILNRFGLPTVSVDTALEALKANVWSSIGDNFIIAFAESLHLIGILGSVAVSGAPVWLLTGAINASYVVPLTCRLFLIMACDLTFVLARSFKEVTFRAGGQPSEKDVSAAARSYRIRGYPQHVHKEIKHLVPRRNALKSFQADAVEQGISAIFAKYKDKLMDDVDLPMDMEGLKLGSERADDDSTEADPMLLKDVENAKVSIAELEARGPIAEPDESKPVAELPVESKASELLDTSSLLPRHELQA